MMTLSRITTERLQRGDLIDITTLTRQQVLEGVLNAWEDPLPAPGGGGRPRVPGQRAVKKIVVFEEAHSDGSKHFHIAVLLVKEMRWAPARRTLLERHMLAAHFSRSHAQWWSAVRYGYVPSPKKPIVDVNPLQWVPLGCPAFSLFDDSQQPYQVEAWVHRREKSDLAVAAAGGSATFTKLDFNTLVLAKGLTTKASVLAFGQSHGTAAMLSFLTRNQKKLNEFLDEAVEFHAAPAVFAGETETDWALLCKTADQACLKGDACEYCVAAKSFFERNAPSFSQRHLANALRKVIVAGPSKNSRVPFLVGTTNTGKSSLIESFDLLYGERRVFHLPAVTDPRFPLRNWLRNKRFVSWDEFDPVEFATARVLPVTTFKKAFNGQWFEIQVPQCHHDGNPDFRWKQGVVFANRLEGLWETNRKVPIEDIRHMQARVEQFECTSVFVPPGQIRPEIPQCAVHLARWVRDGAALFDAQSVVGLLPLGPPVPAAPAPAVRPVPGAPAVPPAFFVVGLAEVLHAARLGENSSTALSHDVLALGALDVRELLGDDLTSLPSWAALRPLERRRLWGCMAWLGPCP